MSEIENTVLTPLETVTGWIKNDGKNKRPLRGGDYIKVKLRSGLYDEDFARVYNFSWLNEGSDIVAYLVCKPEPKAQPTDNPLDSQVGGDHYKKLGQYQPWEVLARWMTPDELRGFAKGTAIAYLARERDKGGDADIAKALHTLQLWQALKDTNAPESTP